MRETEQVVCVIDDDRSAREAIVGLVRSAGLHVEEYASAHEYLATPHATSPGCLVLDVVLPGLTGLELQTLLRRKHDDIPIVFVSGHVDVSTSVQAIRGGALDFLTKPFDPNVLLSAIHGAMADSPGHRAPACGVVGASDALADVLVNVRTVAHTSSTVLIQGETGTGKELIARAIHEQSDRKQGPFVKVNCGAIPTGLLESELMGHEKGAFTGATAQRIGRFELAHDGTLFLDEIGELAMELQPKLLRLLQEREFERIGGTRTVRSNARLITATNRDLRAMVKARTFREDLYYRLNVFPITLPPLRNRRQDIPDLAEHFMRRLAVQMNKQVRSIAPAALERLQQHDWPGNIRELENVIERAMIMTTGTTLDVPPLHDDIDPDTEPEPDNPEGQSNTLASVTRAHILEVLESTAWVVAGPYGAAARLGVKRSTLTYRMKKLGISSPRSRPRVLPT